MSALRRLSAMMREGHNYLVLEGTFGLLDTR